MSNGVIGAYGAHLDEIRRVMDERPSACRPVTRASSIRCWAITEVQRARYAWPSMSSSRLCGRHKASRAEEREPCRVLAPGGSRTTSRG